MCRAVTCKTCNRPTWAGCGAHVEQVLGHIPAAQRCQCRAEAGSSGGSPVLDAIKGLFRR